jgi:pimeloyl-ACP methyl ester carboxylesterase
MDTQRVSSACPANADTLIVFLPGRGSLPSEFEREGFLQELKVQRIAADAILADAHLGYYNNRSIVERLEADVLAPARAQGYKSIWLVGISLGGFGALIHEDMRPGGVAGIVLLAPYLGEGERSPAAEVRPGRPPLYLGYGTSDRFAASHRLLAQALPKERVFTTPGGHDWPQWRRLWQQLLPTLPLPRC